MASRSHLRLELVALVSAVAAATPVGAVVAEQTSRPERPATAISEKGLDRWLAVARAGRRHLDHATFGSFVTPPILDDAALYPGVVAVGDGRRWDCSGTLVGNQLVLTAKHCGNPTSVSVGAIVNAPGAYVVAVVPPPILHSAADAMLLRLQEPLVPLTSYPIARDCSTRSGPPRKVDLVGFGLRWPSGAFGSGWRAYGRVSVDHFGCDGAQAPPSRAAPCQPDLEFALPASPSIPDTCPGDSGGPVIAATKRGPTVVGVTSRGITSNINCGRGGIYVRADVIAEWARGYGASVAACPF